MKKIFFPILILFLLSGCVSQNNLTNSPTENETTLKSKSFEIKEISIGNSVLETSSIKEGDLVELEFKAFLEDGTLVDQSLDENNKRVKEPLKFRVGKGEIIKGLNSRVIGLKLNEDKIIVIPSNEGFQIDLNKFLVLPEQKFLDLNLKVEIGSIVSVNNLPAIVRNKKDGNVLLDFNQPLAGKKLIFWVKATRIEK